MLHIPAIGEERVFGIFLAIDGLHAIVIPHAFPVVVGTIDIALAVLCVDIVAADIVAAGHVEISLLVGGCRAVGDGHGGDAVFVFYLGRSLIVVVHHVDVAATGTAIASARAPVEDEAVAEVDVFGLHSVEPFVGGVETVGSVSRPVVASTIEAWCAVGHVRDHVMVEAGELAAPDAAIAVSSLVVSCIVEALAECAPLHGEVVVVVERSHLVDTPRQRAVVEDEAVEVLAPAGVSTVVELLFLSASDTYEPYDVVVTGSYGVVPECDAGVGGCLSENGGVGANLQF